jgi:hypothetical protein
VLAVAIAVVVVVVVAGARWYAVRERAPGGDSPKEAVQAWLDAAKSGRPAEIRRVVAPSQRTYVRDDNPTGTGIDRLEARSVLLGDFTPGGLAPDEGYIKVNGGTVCPPGVKPKKGDRDLRCRDLKGSGADDTAMVVREEGRWWAVAAPFRLVARRPLTSSVTAVITQRLELHGGIEQTLEDTEEVRDRSCRNVELGPFTFNPIREDIRLIVSPDETNDPPGADVIGPRLVSLSSGRSSWAPTGPITLTRNADNTAGSLVIDRWKSRPVFDDPVLPSVSGRLTWSCRDER